MSNIKDIRCNPRLQDFVLAGWPPCCATLFVVVVVGPTRPWSMPLAIFNHEKTVAWVSISMHACDPFPIVMGLRLAALGAAGAPLIFYFLHRSLPLTVVLCTQTWTTQQQATPDQLKESFQLSTPISIMLRQTTHVQDYQRNIWIKQQSVMIRNRVTAMVTQVLKT